MTDALRLEEADDHVLVRLARPAVRNAIDLQTVDELHAVCDRLERSPRTAILVGDGEDFAAGADIGQLVERRRADALRGINSSVFDRIHRLPMPTIALLDGHVLGGGAELAYACDFRIGTPRISIGNPEPGLGIIAAAGGTWRLRELVGEPVAKQVLLAGRILDADAALAVHLVTDIVAPDELLGAGRRLAARIARSVPLAVRLTKSAMHAPRGAHPYIDDLTQAVLFETDEKTERMRAFLDRKEQRS